MTSPNYAVIVTEPFKDDLTTVVRWRLENVGRSSAGRLISSYEAAISAIEAFPYFMPSARGDGLRWVAVENLVAIYEIDEANNTVTLLRLLNMASDWRAELLHLDKDN